MSSTDSSIPHDSAAAAARIRTRALTVVATILAAIIVWVIEVPVAGIYVVVHPVGAPTRGTRRWPRTTSRGVIRVRAHPPRPGAP
jgi:hypothetical protein